MFTHYSKEDIFLCMTTAKDNNKKVYVEYLTKKNVLKSMQVTAQNIYDNYAIVIDLAGGGIKRLNFEQVFKIGIEGKENA